MAAAGLALGCGSGGGSTGPSSGCGSTLSFSVLPVPISAVLAATPLGNMGPPTHTIPTDHSGLYLAGTGITLSAPGSLRVTSINRVHYLVSPFRQGDYDYSISANTCNGYQLGLGHIQTAVAKISSQTGTSCTTYSTAEETVESCRNNSPDASFAAGETIGTVGGPTAGAFDLGLYNPVSQNNFVNPGRYSSLTLTATCAYDPFAADLRAQLYAKIGYVGLPASGEAPICGSMNVDMAGTARGVWVLQSAPVNQAGDETNFAALVPHPLYPVSGQTFSLGPASLNQAAGPGLVKYPVATSGRVNRQFRDVTGDDLIYCFVYDASAATFSYFVRLAATGVLTIEKLSHVTGATPCSQNPSGWAFGGGAANFIR